MGERISRRGVLQAGLAAGAVAGTGAWRAAPGEGRPPRRPGSLPYPKLPAGTDTIPQIEHIVVLMMENHSYDNQLGHAGRPGADGFTARQERPPIDANPYPTGSIQHAFRMPTTCQLSGAAQPGRGPASHIQLRQRAASTASSESAQRPGASMGYWEQADLPFYYSLARQFPIADRYFCSVLGQTYPNRRYLLAATSLGQIDDTAPALTDYPANGTIFDRLDAHGITWKDYFTSDLALASRCSRRCYLKNAGTNVVPIAEFFTDAAAGTLPGLLPRRARLRHHVRGEPAEHRRGRGSSPRRSSTR